MYKSATQTKSGQTLSKLEDLQEFGLYNHLEIDIVIPNKYKYPLSYLVQ